MDELKNSAAQSYDDVAVLIPCFNEERTIAQVVADFRAHLPGSKIYVFDNRSTDASAERARKAGANVVFSSRRGKGNVVKHMFNSVEAGVYLMADGDSTYAAADAPRLLATLRDRQADMVVGTRMDTHAKSAFRRFHVFGNRMVARLITTLFGVPVTDVLSGYRAFSRDYVKTVPLVSTGFDIETEMTLQAVAKNFLLVEESVSYGERPEGSFSKLSTFSDGYLVLKALILIFKDYRPFLFFGSISLLLLVSSVVAGYGPVYDYIEYRYVYRVPLAILAAALATVSLLALSVGIILETVRKFHGETFELWHKRYLQERNGK